MTRKNLSLIGVILVLFVLQSCQSKPEENLLKRYFQAVSLNDMRAMSTMALEPVNLDVKSWEIVSINEEKIAPALLPELNKMELMLQKKVEESVIITLDAKDELLGAEYELERTRTRYKRSVQKEVNELQAKYDERYANYLQLKKDYNEAKAVTAREEQICSFSLGAGDITNIRDLTGQVHFKEVEVKVEGKSDTKNYKIYLRKYDLKDEALNVNRRGRWIIVALEETKLGPFPLTIEKRKQIYHEHTMDPLWALDDGSDRVPKKLAEKYMKKYNLTKSELAEILFEGAEKYW